MLRLNYQDIEDIIRNASHRPWALPSGRWSYYQEWNDALFLHWAVPAAVVQALLPPGLIVDTIEDTSWVSLVAFTMERIRPRGLPAISLISDFHEVNLRVYVIKDNKPGVYFLNIEAQKTISVLVSRALSGLPYEKALITRTQNGHTRSFVSQNAFKGFYLEAQYEIDKIPYKRTVLDKWLIERYSLYLNTGGQLYRYDIHHQEWNVRQLKLQKLNVRYRIGNLVLNSTPDLYHSSEGVRVVAWKRRKV